ncbi:MAG: AAA family ATPase [Micropruina sp.]|nr:MAG: AAA family ATPase [Micropruina sp.]
MGGPLYLHDLVSGVAVVSNAPHYATIIREHAERRRLIERLTRLQQEALSGRDLTVLREQIQTIADDQPRTSAGTTLERYPALDLADLLNPDRPPREWVVAGLLPARASTALVAPAGTAKSLLSLGLAIHVSQGRRHFAGFDIPSRRQVLYIDMENTPTTWPSDSRTTGSDQPTPSPACTTYPCHGSPPSTLLRVATNSGASSTPTNSLQETSSSSTVSSGSPKERRTNPIRFAPSTPTRASS